MSDTFVRLRIGAESYALPVEDVLEVTQLGTVTPVPGAMSAVLGVMNLRGQVLPVVALEELLVGSVSTDVEHVVIIDHANEKIGLAVPEVTDIARLPDLTQVGEGPHIQSAAIVNNELVGVVNTDSIVETVGVAYV